MSVDTAKFDAALEHVVAAKAVYRTHARTHARAVAYVGRKSGFNSTDVDAECRVKAGAGA